jgi:hypothetical protein
MREGDRIGLAEDCSGACAFGLHLEKTRTEGDFLRPDGSADEDIRAELSLEREQLFCYLGYVPVQTIQLYAGCNGRIDHRILGELTLLLARRYKAMINLQGALYPPLKRGRDILDATVEEVEQYIRELSLPGEICHVYYTTGRYTPWLYHLVDADFLAAWLQHPHFHMIK